MNDRILTTVALKEAVVDLPEHCLGSLTSEFSFTQLGSQDQVFSEILEDFLCTLCSIH